jgi:hypothetical protein
VAHHVRRLAGQFPEGGPHQRQPPDVEQPLTFPEAGAHPRIVVLQVAAAPPAAEHPATRGDRPDPSDELGQVGGEVGRPGGVVFVAGAAGQPGLHRPRQRVTGARLADGDLLGHGEPGGGGQFPGGRRLGLERAADGGGVGHLQREARGELVAEAEDRVDRAR